jgi:hypothetical protein
MAGHLIHSSANGHLVFNATNGHIVHEGTVTEWPASVRVTWAGSLTVGFEEGMEEYNYTWTGGTWVVDNSSGPGESPFYYLTVDDGLNWYWLLVEPGTDPDTWEVVVQAVHEWGSYTGSEWGKTGSGLSGMYGSYSKVTTRVGCPAPVDSVSAVSVSAV